MNASLHAVEGTHDPSDPASHQSGDYSEQWKHHAEDALELIRRTRDYIVQVTKKYTLDWETTQSYDFGLEVAAGYNSERHAALDADISHAEEVPLEGFTDDLKLAYLCLIGKAMACRFEFKYNAADTLLERAATFIAVRRTELSREWYLSATFITGAVPIGIGILAVLFRHGLISLLGLEGLYLLLATCAGSLGAMLSIIRRAGRIDFDQFASKRLHTIEAAARITVGCIAALTVSLAVRAHIIAGAWVNGDNQLLALLAVAIVAGTSEQLVVSVIDGIHSGLRTRGTSTSPTGRRSTNSKHQHVSTKPNPSHQGTNA